ncbi:MAG: M16 family metallopeptidase [Chthonomonadales bacterium]
MRSAFALMLLLFLPMPGASQEFPASPPADLPARPFRMPPVFTSVLPNGLKVLVAQSRRVPLVTVRLAIPAGSVYDPASSPGLAAAVANQLTAGTDKYTSRGLREAAEKLGGSLSARAGTDFVTVQASALSENVRPLLELLADALLHPSFPAEELSIYKGLTIQRLSIQRQDPSFLAEEQMDRMLYGNHPYGVAAPSAAAVQALTPDALRTFWRSHYAPAGSVLVVAGDVDGKRTIEAVRQVLASWSGSPPAQPAPPADEPASGRRVLLVDRPASVQADILMGNRAIRRNDPDYYALSVASAILGGSASSRLFLTVRERDGYAYDAHSSVNPQRLAGAFTEAAQVRTEATVPAIEEMIRQTEKLRTEPVTQQELSAVQNYIKGRFVLQMVTQAGLADALLAQQIYGLPADYLTAYRSRIDAVTAADVQRVAQRYMNTQQFRIVVVGDGARLREALQTLGPVEALR